MLVELIYNHYEIELIKQGLIIGSGKKIVKPQVSLDFIVDRVDQVEVSPKSQTLQINYKDGTYTKLSPHHDAYYVE
ncbi:hypothetical protein SAMN05518855_1005138 [Paenibacillus sp. CF384]|nr:hypothetical protein SAMN05518855_1005138 [Paenibacillus sp. CF384]